MNRYLYFSMVLFCGAACAGCSLLEATGEAVGVVGKAGWAATTAVGSAVYTGTSMAGQTANQTNKTLAGKSAKKAVPTVSMDQARVIVPLEREGKSFFVRLKLNGTITARFLVDTGASAMQVSRAMAKKLKLKSPRAKTVPVMLAGGSYVRGRIVELDEVAIGAAKACHVKAVVLEHDDLGARDGLLGMTFLENFIFSIDTEKGELVLEKRP
jgi:clan AA aspartic protease (TIGR02281 family)